MKLILVFITTIIRDTMLYKETITYHVIIATLIRAKHNTVGSLIVEISQVLVLRINGYQLQVGPAAFLSILKDDFVLYDQWLVIENKGLVEQRGQSSMPSLALEH